MQGSNAVRETAQKMLQEVCGGGSVDEDDGWFGEVLFGEQQDVEVFFLVYDVDQTVGLV